MKLNKTYIIASVIALVCVIAAVCLELISHSLLSGLLHQTAANRYMGEAGTDYKQFSVFFGVNNRLTTDEVKSVEDSINQNLKDNSVNAESEDSKLWYDAWSVDIGEVTAGGVKDSEVICLATCVGGDFFKIHSMRLMDGSYIEPDDLMDDRVVIDTVAAWSLMGSSEISNMEITIDNVPYLIAGVVESDKPSDSVYGSAGRIWMPYPPSAANGSSVGTVSCYEAVLPNPVRNFAKNCMDKAFGMKSGKQILNNTDRGLFASRFEHLRNLRQMVAVEDGIAYPWWENAARLRDYTVAQLFGVEILLLIFPVFCLCAGIWILYKFLSALISKKIEENKRRYRTIEKDPYAT